MNQLTYVLIFCCVCIIACMVSQSPSEHYASETSSYEITNQALMNPQVPHVLGVPIVDKMQLVVDSGKMSGMMPQGMELMSPSNAMKGHDAYGIGKEIIANTLELDTTTNLLRHHLASAMTSYVPPEGVDIDALWYQRNTLQNLKQPGLHAKTYSYSWYSPFGF